MAKLYFIMMNDKIALHKSGTFAAIDEDKVENFVFTKEEAIETYKTFWNDDPVFLSFEEIGNVKFAPFIVCCEESELKTMKGCGNMRNNKPGRWTVGWILKTSNSQPNFFDFIDGKCNLFSAINFSESFPEGLVLKNKLKDAFGDESKDVSIIHCDPEKYFIKGTTNYDQTVVVELSKDVFDDVMVHVVE